MTNEIVTMEWEFFDRVQNIGGRAGCQDDRETFFIMRESQLEAWNPAMRESYLEDLKRAKAAGRNPLSEKYAYMMERTDPVAYANVREALPPRSGEKLALVEEICKAHVAWLRELSLRCPLLTGRGRNIDRSCDSRYATSMETYLWGELSTYSEQTLRLYRAYVEQLQTDGKNMNELILCSTVTLYGYASLEEAEARLAGNAGEGMA